MRRAASSTWPKPGKRAVARANTNHRRGPMYAWGAIAGITLFVGLVVLGMWAFYRAGGEDGYERGYRQGRTDARAGLPPPDTGRYTPRHDAKSQPRAGAEPPSPAAAQPWRFPVTLGTHTAASHIATVLLAPQPAPDLRHAADTGTMPRIQLTDTDTGGMQAITDAWIAEHCEATA